MHVPTPPEIKKNKEGEEISSNTVPHPNFLIFLPGSPSNLQKCPPDIARSQPYPPLPSDC